LVQEQSVLIEKLLGSTNTTWPALELYPRCWIKKFSGIVTVT